VSLVVRFSAELGKWLVQNLNEGRTPSSLVQTMIAERMEPRVADAIMDAFTTARTAGRAVPVDSVVIHDETTEYVYGAPIVAARSRIETRDGPVRVLARAERPVLAVLAGVIAPSECEELIELARPRLTPSTVVDPETGRDVVTDYRNSFGMFFRPGETELIRRLDARAAEIMNLPVENGEGFQVLRYPVGGSAAPHFDFLVPSSAANRASLERSGQRVSSLVIYLNDVASGGETVFPEALWSVFPERGNAVYFEYANRQGQVDHRSLHGSNPVRQGEKWVLTKWMRERPFVSAGT
jgi:prolyl 4-hydroxylase